MALPDPEPALVIRYAYLWWDEARRGQEEGIKDRPAVIVLTTASQAGTTWVVVAPITHVEPTEAAHGVEIPPLTKKRLGLDDGRSWIVISELNRFAWPGPDIRPTDEPGNFAYGYLPAALFDKVVQQLRNNLATSPSRMVTRSD